MRIFATALLAALLPVSANSAVMHINPGDDFQMPAPGMAYLWHIDIDHLSPGDIAAEFTVQVVGTPAELRTFQIFGHCDGASNIYHAGFSLEVFNSNGTDTTWTSATRGEAGGCGYHDYLNKQLPVGPTTFTVTFEGADNPSLDPIYKTAELRFGDILAAIPLPASLALLPIGLAAFGALRLSRKLS